MRHPARYFQVFCCKASRRGGASQIKYAPRLLILKVDAPAGQFLGNEWSDLVTRRRVHEVSSLTMELWKLGCSVEHCRRSPRATVLVERDRVIEKVKAVLSAAGCNVLCSRESRHGNDEATCCTPSSKWRHTHSWNAEPDDGRQAHGADHAETQLFLTRARDIHPAAGSVSSPDAVSMPDPYGERVDAFIAELKEVLLLANSPLEAKDFDLLMSRAEEIVAQEGEQGPHAGLLEPLRILLELGKGSNVPRAETMMSA